MGNDIFRSVNPATEEETEVFEAPDQDEIEQTLQQTSETFRRWRGVPFAEKSQLMRKAADYLRKEKTALGRIITEEMGKTLTESEAEVAKCAWACDYFAEHAEEHLAEERIDSSATLSYVQFVPLGTVLAIMPWNFPFWQVFRFAAPALMAGNTGILKHASNVPRCALAIERVFREAGFPSNAFRSLLISSSAVSRLIEDPRIVAVTLTGSEYAGSQVSATAGRVIKKTVLELGGSDPFIVLEDADLERAVETGVRARYQNCGQSCIAAKRFIVVDQVYPEFRDRFVAAVERLKAGDPMDASVRLGPMARADLRESVEKQIEGSVSQGARLLTGGKRPEGKGYYLSPAVLDKVSEAMPAGNEEVFGPVAAITRVSDSAEAIRVANSSQFGLGSNLWSADIIRARRLARDIESGQVFINGMVASDPRLPFGGVKRSGYGRELSAFGIREFVNIQTVWVGPTR